MRIAHGTRREPRPPRYRRRFLPPRSSRGPVGTGPSGMMVKLDAGNLPPARPSHKLRSALFYLAGRLTNSASVSHFSPVSDDLSAADGSPYCSGVGDAVTYLRRICHRLYDKAAMDSDVLQALEFAVQSWRLPGCTGVRHRFFCAILGCESPGSAPPRPGLGRLEREFFCDYKTLKLFKILFS